MEERITRLELEIIGLKKAQELLLKGYEDICISRDELKHENRSLKEELKKERDKSCST